MVKTISSRLISCKRILTEVLKTHNDLKDDDIAFVSDYVCNLNINDEKITEFILHSLKTTNTGRFSLSFNFYLDNAIIKRDRKAINKLIRGDKMYVELRNENLTKIEKQTIENMIIRERNALKQVLERSPVLISQGRLELNKIILGGGASRTGNNQTLYSRCYNGDCIIPNNMYVIDGDKKYNFDYLQLVDALSRETPINPISGEKMSPQALELLNRRLNKEIKMYQKFMSEMSKIGVYF
jgi:hypothetical protein